MNSRWSSELLAAAGYLHEAGFALDLSTDVAHRLDGAYPRNDVEIVDRRGRRREPLQRVALPRVGPGQLAALEVDHDVGDGHEDPDGEDVGADRRDQVPGRPAQPGLVCVDPPRHAFQAERMLDEEGR